MIINPENLRIKGRPINELTREELIETIIHMYLKEQKHYEDYNNLLNLWKMSD